MDSPHAIGFYVSAALSIGGGLMVAFLRSRLRRSLALLVVGIGVAGIDASLSAGFAAIVVLLSFAVSAALLGRPDYRAVEWAVAGGWRQLGSIAAALLFVALAYAAYRGAFASVRFNGGAFGAASVGTLLFTHDALAVEAVGALVLAALVALTVAWRVRDRSR
jgi:NADH:ubiquinone oxidoreductase subunit 6 (subunit J)